MLHIVRSMDRCTFTLHLCTGKAINLVADTPEAAIVLLNVFLTNEPKRSYAAPKPLKQILTDSEDLTQSCEP